MADSRVTDEATATALNGTELVRVVQSGGSKKTTLAEIAALSNQAIADAVLAAASPAVVKGDLTTRSATAPARLPVGTDGQALVADSAQPLGLKWASIPAAFVNPSTTAGDLIGQTSTSSTRVPVGADGTVLTADAAQPTGLKWAPSSNPTTAKGDLFTRDALIPARLPAGADGTVLVADSTQSAGLKWVAPSVANSPTTAKGDLFTHNGIAPARLPVGVNSTVLTADSGQPNGLRWAVGVTLDIDPTMGANSNTVAPSQSAVVAYVQGLINSRAWKTPARAGTVASLQTNTYANGATGNGATLTATAAGALLAQDGVTLVVGDSLLVKNEAAGQNNGLYVVTQVGGASTPYVLTRRVDNDADGKILNATCAVSEGLTLSDQIWQCTTNAPIVTGTTALVWAVTGTGGGYTSPTTTKGDLIVRGAVADGRQGVGADGQVLTADAAQSAGVKWATPTASASALTVGAYAARPTAAAAGVGVEFYATDVLERFRSDGATWIISGTGGMELGYADTVSSFSTTSGTPVDVPGMSITCVVGERPVQFCFSGRTHANTVGQLVNCVLVLDGVAVMSFTDQATGTDQYFHAGINVRLDNLTPGSTHTFSLQIGSAGAGGSSMVYAAAASPSAIQVRAV